MTPLHRITTWLFDLDNTLYSPHAAIFPQMHRRMAAYIAQAFSVAREEAERLREHYFHAHGTTMRGLMLEHGVDPHEFMDFVHDVDLAAIGPAPRLEAALAALPGEKVVFTNADRKHARRILERLGVSFRFSDIFGIEDANYVCKPDEGPYRALIAKYALDPASCCMVDDMERNLETAARLGMKTLWLRHEAAWQKTTPLPAHHYPHCHYATNDLIPFLENLTKRAA